MHRAPDPSSRFEIPRQAWGSPAGWIFATLLALAIISFLVAVDRSGRMTPMTAFGADPANYGTVVLPVDPATVVDNWPTAAGDATRLYDLAANGYSVTLATRRPYDDFLRDGVRGPALPGDLPLLQHLVEAARYGQAAPLAAEAESLVGYDRSPAKLDALYALGQAALKQAGLLAGRNHPGDAQEARRLYEAAFILGVHLYQERLVHRELEYGYRLISQSLGGLLALAKKQQEAARAVRLSERRDRFTEYVNGSLQPVWEKISAINDVARSDDVADVHIGDVVAIAGSEQADPLWRTEAILRLGKARHDATRRGDREGAQRELEHLARTLTDPRLKRAAQQALELTAAQRMNAR